MKTIKYLFAGVLAMGLSATAMAQDVDYKTALKPIESALEANQDAKTIAALAKDYQKTYKKDEAALVALGQAYLNVKNYDAAEAIANGITNNKKMNGSSAYVLLGDIAAYKDSTANAGDAASKYQQAISVNPNNKTAYERYAAVYRHVSLSQSISKLEEYKKIDPSYQVETKIADLCYGEKQYQKALDWYKKGNIDQYTVGDCQKMALSAYQVFKNDETFELAKKGLAKFPGDANLTRFALWGAVDGSHSAEAITFANDLFKNDCEKGARDYEYLGYAQLAAKDYQNAITNLNKAYEMNAENSKPLSKISECYKELGQEDTALEYMQKYIAVAKNPSATDYQNLGEIYTQKGDNAAAADKQGYYDKALAVYEDFAQKKPAYAAYAYYFASTVAGKFSKDKQAEYDLKTSELLNDPSKVQGSGVAVLKNALTNLMYYYSGKQDFAKIKENAEKLQQLDPNDANAKAMLEYVEKATAE